MRKLILQCPKCRVGILDVWAYTLEPDVDSWQQSCYCALAESDFMDAVNERLSAGEFTNVREE